MKTVGIIGGMGPEATADLFQKIIVFTNAKHDYEHIHILIDNNTDIPDRTEAILNGGENPLPQMLASAERLVSQGADFLAIGCNTAHYFYEDLSSRVSVPILNMVEITMKNIVEQKIHTVGILGTFATLKVGLYDKLSEYGVEIIKPDEADEELIMSMIYDGIKGGCSDYDTSAVKCCLDKMVLKGVEKFILACTELPLAFRNYHLEYPSIDPTTELAKAVIIEAGASLK